MAFGDGDLDRLANVTSGSAVSFTTMETSFEMLEALLNDAPEAEDIPEGVFEVLEIASEHLGGACSTDLGITSTGILLRTLTF